MCTSVFKKNNTLNTLKSSSKLNSLHAPYMRYVDSKSKQCNRKSTHTKSCSSGETGG